MVSFEVLQTLKIPVGIALLAGLALLSTAFPQPASDALAIDAQEQIVEEIQAVQSQDGPHSADLVDPLTTLSLLYQEHGEYVLALAASERAREVVRANYGLHSLDQAALIQQSIENEEARGNAAGAWDLEQELLTLIRRHPADLRTVPIFRKIADKRLDLLRRYIDGEFPPQIVLGCYYEADIGSCTAGSRQVVVQSILSDATDQYAGAISVILRNELFSSDELRELEMELLRSTYLYGGHYETGRRSLRRLLSYNVATSESLLDQMNALIEVADWDLLFEQNGAALEVYEQAYDDLKQRGVAQAAIEQIFSPETPVVLPTFLPNPLVSYETPESTGFIDVAFEVNKYGKSRRIEILDTTTNATDDSKHRLVRLILNNRFRPRVTDGEFARRSPIVLRYYLDE